MKINIVVYSDNAQVRQEIVESVGLKAAQDQPDILWYQAATPSKVVEYVEQQVPQVLILDAETTKEGGFSLARRIQAECEYSGLYIFITARPEDTWLAAWAKANAIIPTPLEPIRVQEIIAKSINQIINESKMIENQT